MKEFRESSSVQERLARFNQIMSRERNRDLVPVIVDYDRKELALSTCRFLVPRDFSSMQFQVCVRRKVSRKESDKRQGLVVTDIDALFFFIESIDGSLQLLPSNVTMFEIQSQYQHPDGFIYCHCSKESTFGGIGNVVR